MRHRRRARQGCRRKRRRSPSALGVAFSRLVRHGRRRGTGARRVRIAEALIAGDHVRVARLEGAVTAIPCHVVVVFDDGAPWFVPPSGGLARANVAAHRRGKGGSRKYQACDRYPSCDKYPSSDNGFHHRRCSLRSRSGKETNTARGLKLHDALRSAHWSERSATIEAVGPERAVAGDPIQQRREGIRLGVVNFNSEPAWQCSRYVLICAARTYIERRQICTASREG